MKNLKNLGKVLKKEEQKMINGGGIIGGCQGLPNGRICAGGFKCCNGSCITNTQYYLTCIIFPIHQENEKV